MQGIELLVGKLSDFLSTILPEGDLKSLIIDGAVAGVGNVLIFIPQIAILVFLLTLLEDSGYLARAAFLMDRIFRPFGLQGRSFVPLLSSFACAIPGIISTRTIANRSDRLATILIAPLMSCSARLPVYTVLIGACIPHELVFGIFSLQGIVLLSMYLLGIVAALLVSLVLKLTILKGKPSLFVMEMPPFRRPKLTNGLREAFDRSRDFIQSAGSMILACSILLWALASYPKFDTVDANGTALTKSEQLKMSYAGQIGSVIEPVIKPLGFDWQIGVAILTSFAAREVFVSTLATMYNIEEDSEGEDDGGSLSLKERIQAKNLTGEFTTASAVSLMIFYVFACQCMSTLAICKRETGHWGWSVLMFCYMTVLAYLGSWGWYGIFR